MADFDEEKQRCFPLCYLDKCLHGTAVNRTCHSTFIRCRVT